MCGTPVQAIWDHKILPSWQGGQVRSKFATEWPELGFGAEALKLVNEKRVFLPQKGPYLPNWPNRKRA